MFNNVHQMLHITDVAIQFEGLDECRSFAFENFNEKLKIMVCCGRIHWLRLYGGLFKGKTCRIEHWSTHIKVARFRRC